MSMTAVVATVGLGLSLYDRYKQNKLQDDLKTDLKYQRNKVQEQGFQGVTDTLDSSLELFQDRKEQDKKILTEETSTKLKSSLDQVRDGGATFAGSGSRTNQIDTIDKSLWSALDKGSMNLNRQEENAKLGAYSTAFRGAADIRTQMNELEAQINSLS
tara:strand:- start:405 stop:878 length:474 start_codon:yes stop_codon:yes gene_type:complete